MNNLFLPTLKEVPKEASIASHILMLRAGLVRKSASGLYSYLPLGNRVLQKVMQIVREEMDKAGGQEFLLPILTSRELWEEAGRYDLMGKQMFRLQDRHKQDFVLGPTHEEAFTDIVRSFLNSYKQLPLLVYQIHKKFRDEIRPRFGMMRAREFFMKDAYSFHTDAENLDKVYQRMRKAYRRVFYRCGLDTVPVNADSGAMGGKESEEFMVRSHIGEDTIIECPACNYVANIERADCVQKYSKGSDSLKEMETVDTPAVKTIEELTKFFKVGPENFIKTIIYHNESDERVVVLIRGDLEINEVKLSNALGGTEYFLASDAIVNDVTGADVGFAGPVGLKDVTILADESVKYMVNAITGANETDKHIKNVNPERDFKVIEYTNLRLVQEGDLCPECEKPMKSFEGIEVGHIFKLGYKYTQEMKVEYLNEAGKGTAPIMGTYGIGIDRTMATVIEQNHDDDGIIFPMSIAPFHVILLPLAEEGKEIAEKLYEELWNRGVEVLLDDRKARPGVRFKDADLIGIPIRVTLGKKSLAENKAELRLRKVKENQMVDLDNLTDSIEAMVKAEMDELKQTADTVKV